MGTRLYFSLNTEYDALMDYEEHQRVKNNVESSRGVQLSWIQQWKQIAGKFGISHIDVRLRVLFVYRHCFFQNTTNDATFNRLQILPNVVPVIVIAHTEPNNVMIVYGRRRDAKEDISLQTVLRHSYSNVPQGNLQVQINTLIIHFLFFQSVYFMTKNLLDLHSQLFSRQVSPEFRTEHFRCLPTLWLQYDVFGAILDKIHSQTKPKMSVQLHHLANTE